MIWIILGVISLNFFDFFNYIEIIIFIVISLVFDIFLESERIELNNEKIMIYGLRYDAIFNKKPKIVFLKDIEKIVNEKMNIPCFSNLFIFLKNGDKLIISKKDIQKNDLVFLSKFYE